MLVNDKMSTSRKPRVTAVRKRPQQARSQVTVDYILSAAARLLEQDGYDGTNTNRIAETAGISVGSLYQYFPSKDAIVSELFDREHARYLEAVKHRLAESAGDSFENAIRALVQATGELFTKQRYLVRTLAERIPDLGRFSRVFEMRMGLVEVLREHIDSQICRHDTTGCEPMDTSLLAFVLGNTLSGMYSTYAMAPLDAPIPSVQNVEDELVKLVMGYVTMISGCSQESAKGAGSNVSSSFDPPVQTATFAPG
jgi:AcrR family transcriptional regulator